MATLKPVRKISARPQIKAVQQPIPRQVILPKKAQPVAKAPAKAVGVAMPTNVISKQNVQISPAEAQRIMNMQKAPSIPMMAQPLPSLPMQQNTNYSQFQNITNPIMNQSSVGTVGYPANGSETSIYQGQQNPVMANIPAPMMSESSVGSIGYPADGNTTNYQGQQPFNPTVTTFSGFNQPQNSYMDYTNNTMQLPAGYNTGSVPSAMPQQGGPMVMPQQGGNTNNYGGFGGPAVMPQQGGTLMPYSGEMPNYAMSGDYMGGQGSGVPFMQSMNQLGVMPQQGFMPMGGNNPQNTSTGSFGAIQQPMGSFGNIGSLLG